MNFKSKFEIRDKNQSRAVCATIANNVAELMKNSNTYAKYVYCMLSDNREFFFESRVSECNADVAQGELFVVHSAIASIDEEVSIVEIGLCSQMDMQNVFCRTQLQQPLQKQKDDDMLIACTIHLSSNGQAQFCCGDNQLVKCLLGIHGFGDEWGVVFGQCSEPNVPLYRVEQSDVSQAQLSLLNARKLQFECDLPNVPVYEILLCFDNSPVLRQNVSNVVADTTSNYQITNGIIQIENQANTFIDIMINGIPLADIDELRFGKSVSKVHEDVCKMAFDGNCELFGDSQSKYLGIKSASQIFVFTKNQAGGLDIVLCVQNNEYKVDITSNGCLFLYRDGQLIVWYEYDGVWAQVQVGLENVQNFAVVSNDDYTTNEIYTAFLVCLISNNAQTFLFDKRTQILTKGKEYAECRRILKIDKSLIYIDDRFSQNYHIVKWGGESSAIEELFAQTLKGRELYDNFCGMFLYDDGVQYNTIYLPQVKSTGIFNGKVFLCGCYLIEQENITNDIKVILYNRANDWFELAYQTQMSDKVVQVAKIEDCIVLLDTKGKLTILQHSNDMAFVTRFDLKQTDTITRCWLQKRTSGYQNEQGYQIKTKIALEF